MNKPLVIAIMGPTASGKTAVALEIARHIPCEIVSVDSALVYCGMDVGTAKPTPAERAAVPHHLIDILDPQDSYSAMQFRTHALELIHQIQARGKFPVLVGGTMLYFKALKEGLDHLPPANLEIRTKLDQEAERNGVPALHAQLARIDPETAARLKPNDSQRIQRALEVFHLTGQPMSQLLAQMPKKSSPFDWIPVSLEPSDRSALHARIGVRFEAMLNAPNGGLIEEVKQLRTRKDLHPRLSSMRCVGYRQTWEYLDGAYDKDVLLEKGIAATRQLAKRQLTWLRSIPEKTIIDCLAPHPARAALDHIQSTSAFLSRARD